MILKSTPLGSIDFDTRSNSKKQQVRRKIPWLLKMFFALMLVPVFGPVSNVQAQCPAGQECSASIDGPLMVQINLNSPSAQLNNSTISNIISAAGGCGYGGGVSIFDFLVFDAVPSDGDIEPAMIRVFDCDDVGGTFTRWVVLEDQPDNNMVDDCDAPAIALTITVVDVDDPAINPSGNGPMCAGTVMLMTDSDYDFTGAANVGMVDAGMNYDCSSDLTWATPEFVDNCGFDSITITFSAQSGDPVLPDDIIFGGMTGLPLPGTPSFDVGPVTFSGDPENCPSTTRVTYTLTDPSGATTSCFFDVIVTDNELPTWANPYPALLDLISSEAASNGPISGIWDGPSSSAVNIVLDCNAPTYSADSLVLANFVPNATDNCDTTLTAVQNLDTDADLVCASRLGINNVVTSVFRNYFTVEDECGNALDHDLVGDDNDGDDNRLRLLVFTADLQGPILSSEASATENVDTTLNGNGGSDIALDGNGAKDFTFEGADVEFDIDDASACTFTVTNDTLAIDGMDCGDITYSWVITTSVDADGNPTGLAGTASDAPSDNDVANGPSTTSVSTFPVGTHTIVYTAVDPCLNESTFTFDLVINDATAPDFGMTCPDDIVATANLGTCEAQVAWMVPVPTDCGGIASFEATATVVDNNGDPIGPAIPINTGIEPGGTCVDVFNFTGIYNVGNWVVVNNGTGGSVDESNAPVSVEMNVGNGDNVEYTVGVTDNGVIVFDYDMATNGGISFRAVVLEYSIDGNPFTTIDIDFPFFSTNGTIQIPVSTGEQLTLRLRELGPGGGTATISNFSFNCAQAAFADFPVGTSCVTYIAIDNAGNEDTCKFNVTVQDLEMPTIANDVADQVLFLDEVDCSDPVVPDYTSLGDFADNCGIDSVLQAPAPGDVLPTLVHNTSFEVVLTAYSNGQTVADTFDVTINDNIDPTVLCRDDIEVTANASCQGTVTTLMLLSGYVYSDDCNITNAPSAPTLIRSDGVMPVASPFPLGETTITATFADAAGNTTSCTFKVTVNDETAPSISTMLDMNVETSDDGTGDCDVAVTWTPTVTDNCDATPTVISSPPSGTVFGPGTHPVVITAIDASGNSDTETFNVIVTDDEAPELQNCQASLDLATICDEAPVPNYFPGAVDNCGIASEVQSPTPGTELQNITTWIAPATGPADGAQFEVEFIAFDQAGLSDTCTTIVTLSDGEDPIPNTIPLPDLESTCGSLTVVAPTANDCDELIYGVPSNGGVLVAGSNPPEYTFVPADTDNIIWTYIDAQGHNSQQLQSIVVVEDVIDPTVICPASLTTANNTAVSADADCQATFSAGTIAITEGDLMTLVEGQYADNCDLGTNPVTYSLSGATTVSETVGSDASGETYELGTTVVTFTVTDTENNSSSCTMMVEVVDDTNPVLVGVPANTTASCDNIPTAATVTATDNCTTSLTVLFSEIDTQDSDTDACGNNSYTITRTWTVTDGAMNSTSAVQVITVQDIEAPAFSADLPATIFADNATGDCSASVMVSVPSTMVSDNCDDDVVVTNDYTPNGANADGVYPVGTTTVIFTATDNCLNSSTYSVDVIVSDNEEPEMICVNINVPLTSDGTADIEYDDMVLTFSDNCTDMTDLVPTFTVSPSSFVCADLVINPLTGQAIPIPVTITVTDDAGNVATCVSNITLQENVIPEAVCQDISVYLDANGMVTVEAEELNGGTTDNCEGDLIYSINGFPEATYECINVGTFSATLTAEDPAGNTDQCQAMITVLDTVAPDVVCQMLEVVLDENGEASIDAQDLDGGSSDACGILSYGASQLVFDCNDLGSSMVTLTVTDNNGNSASEICTINILDETGPEVMCIDQTVFLNANGTLEIDASIFDDGSTDVCSGTNLTFSFEGGGASQTVDCNNIGTNPITIEVEDEDGNVSTCTPNLTVLPNDEVAFTASDESGATGSFLTVEVSVDNFFEMGSFQFPGYIDPAIATITAIQVGPDLNTGLFALSFDPLTGEFFVAWSSSPSVNLNDGDIAFTITVQLVANVLGDMSIVDLDDTQPAPNAFEVAQGCGPIPAITSGILNDGSVSVGSANATISGFINTEEGTPVQQVNVVAADAAVGGNIITSDVTDVNGYYELIVPAGTEIWVIPSKDINHKNGVTALDGAICQAAGAGLPVLQTPYKRLAGDVNTSSSVTALDGAIIQFVVVTFNATFHNPPAYDVNSWTFVDADHVFTVPTNPWNAPFPADIYFANAVTASNQNFVGIKTGDVTASANPANFTGSGDALYLQVKDQSIKAGDEIVVPFLAKDFNDMLALQATLEFNTDVLEYSSFNTGALASLNENVIGLESVSDGWIGMAWFEAQSIDVADNEVLFTITFNAKEDAEKLSDIIHVGSSIAAPAAYRGDRVEDELDLEFFNVTSTINETAFQFDLMQNKPNPFKGTTLIGFTLPTPSPATITVLDVTGKVVWSAKGDYSKGYNEVTIDQGDLPVNGIYYYQLETTTDIAVKKMSLID